MSNANGELPIDDAHTNRSHVGEAIADERGYPGYILIGLGLAALGLALVAAGYGFRGWALLAGIVCAASFAFGVFAVLMERRRIKRFEGRDLLDQEGH
ncbi:hypothetical protein [Rhodococcus sp. IEGM 1379]|uniref:hypothetical protein n=1 Tax=Rhodococcus sp. IEGM 1379 TaxID=3047086 RepID=UPI0024B6EDB2|nr:hypothetical protein [Rhodococcus sp. IEGM 1379]MDI9913727.1 hypothetical protein [Rhodococcus sp. IEGM 1379]